MGQDITYKSENLSRGAVYWYHFPDKPQPDLRKNRIQVSGLRPVVVIDASLEEQDIVQVIPCNRHFDKKYLENYYFRTHDGISHEAISSLIQPVSARNLIWYAGHLTNHDLQTLSTALAHNFGLIQTERPFESKNIHHNDIVRAKFPGCEKAGLGVAVTSTKGIYFSKSVQIMPITPAVPQAGEVLLEFNGQHFTLHPGLINVFETGKITRIGSLCPADGAISDSILISHFGLEAAMDCHHLSQFPKPPTGAGKPYSAEIS